MSFEHDLMWAKRAVMEAWRLHGAPEEDGWDHSGWEDEAEKPDEKAVKLVAHAYRWVREAHEQPLPIEPQAIGDLGAALIDLQTLVDEVGQEPFDSGPREWVWDFEALCSHLLIAGRAGENDLVLRLLKDRGRDRATASEYLDIIESAGFIDQLKP